MLSGVEVGLLSSEEDKLMLDKLQVLESTLTNWVEGSFGSPS